MDNVKEKLIEQAREKYGKVQACGNRKWDDSFTVHDDQLMLWFNDAKGSTHLISTSISDC
jgi:hypothetical protein